MIRFVKTNRVNRYVLIVAGGSGSRMGATLPKQFLTIAEKPLLFYTIESFAGQTSPVNIILVLPEVHISYWRELCKSFNFNIPHKVVAGGKCRGESVKKGLEAIGDPEAMVAIHDGVRPFVDSDIIEKAFALASANGTAVPVCEITDSVRIIENATNRSFNRQIIRSVQTPQCFKLSILREAYNSPDSLNFTDDAGLLEYKGFKIFLFDGNRENIKITTPFDLLVAEAIIKKRKNQNRD